MKAEMRIAKIAALVLVSFVVLACSMIEVGHVLRFGHFAPLGLHADVIVRKVDYGIPGISKAYEPRLSNFGIAPETVTVCEVREDWDSASYVMEVNTSIERWDPNSMKWEDIFRDIDKSSWCPHVTTKRLLPLQGISGGEVTAATYDAFAIGDAARFVVFPGNRKPVPTTPVLIDEHSTAPGVSLRVRLH
jgi:hypothetical protein